MNDAGHGRRHADTEADAGPLQNQVAFGDPGKEHY